MATLPDENLPPLPPPPSPPPPRIPDYELLRLIGRGSYGDVWLARSVTGVYCAIKIVLRSRFDDALPYEREFNGLKNFSTISLVEARQLSLLHVGRRDEDGFFYYVMELADDVASGRDIDPAIYQPLTLREVRRARGFLPAGECIDLAVELARALGGLHAHGLVHRDVKPSNVIFVAGKPKFADIGLVTARADSVTFVGTEGFVPPEGPGATSADVFALGKLLYELVTGLDRHDYPRLPPDLSARTDVRQLLEFNEILLRACATQASQRYPSAAELLQELLILQAGHSVRGLRGAERLRRRLFRALAVTGIVATIAVAGVFIERARANREYTARRAAEAERDDLARKTLYSATFIKAQRALETGELAAGRRFLESLKPAPGESDLRGFEWHALWREAQGTPSKMIRPEGPHAVDRVAVSPDARLIAVHSSDKCVTFYDAATHAERSVIAGVHRLAGFSADGRWIVGTTPEFALQRWSLATGAPDAAPPAGGVNRPLAALPGGELALSFVDSPDGTQHTPHALRIWDFARNEEAARILISDTNTDTRVDPSAAEILSAAGASPSTARWDFYRAAVSPDGTRVAVALISGRVHTARWRLLVLHLPEGRVLFDEVTAHEITTLAFTPDSRALACATSDNAEIALLDITRARWSWRRTALNGEMTALAFSPDGMRFVVGTNTARAMLFDMSNAEEPGMALDHAHAVDTFVWLPGEGKKTSAIVSGGQSGAVCVWSDLTAHQQSKLVALWRPIGGGGVLVLSADGTLLAANQDTQSVTIFDSDTLVPVQQLKGARKPVKFIANNRELLTLGAQGHLQRWRTADGTLIDETAIFDTPAVISDFQFRTPSLILLAGDTTGWLCFWNLETRSVLKIWRADEDICWSLAFSPNGKTAISIGSSLRLKFWEVPSGRLLRETQPSPLLKNAWFSGDGRWLACALITGEVELYDANTLEKKRTIATAGTWAIASGFTDDRLRVGGANGAVHFLSLDDGREIATLRAFAESDGGGAPVVRMEMSEDGSTLAALMQNGYLRIWRR